MNYIERYWRDAKPEDAIKEPPMVARFLSGKSEWFIGKLCGCWRDLHGDNPKWGDGSGLCHTTCQVYDAPDPGEGWRLLDVGERLQEGDQFYNSVADWVGVCLTWSSGVVLKGSVYRRRIAPQYVPYTWDDREELRGRWIYRSKDGNIIEEIAFKFDSRVFNGVAKHLLEDGWHFLDTGKPVGKEVQA